VIVIEAIKLLESDLAKMVNAVWVVDASYETQMRRLTEKRKMSEEEARKRIAAQRPQADKIARANVIIMNDGNLEETWKQVQAAWMEIRRTFNGELTVPAASQAATTLPSNPASVTVPSAKPRTGQLGQPAAAAGTVQPLRPLQPAVASQPVAQPAIEVQIRRGMPGNAQAIADFKSRLLGKPVERMDVMLAFGQKSYLLAMNAQEQILGLTGWQVENLITRVDEFYVDDRVPRDPVVRALTNAIEDASRELQSEVSFIFLPANTPVEIIQAFLTEGYNFLKLEEIKFPAWREAASELLSNDGQALMKQLRADRVMKPI
ncbi:MAG: dephospho-CoA kinase, partial [Anaerolinea sp.]|nr:dephospho-CoA kinase [Anaerolinea sp.]